MKKLFLILVAAISMLAVASCSMLDDSVESLEFATMPNETVVFNTTGSNSLSAKVVILGGESAGTYDLNVSAEGDNVKVTALKNGAEVTNPFTVSGWEGLKQSAEVGNYVLVLSVDGLTLIHNYRVVSKASDAYFAGGEGSKESPFLIETAQQLFNVRYAIGDGNNYFKLVNNINLTNFKWTAIGSTTKPFAGHFDGDNKVITGLSNALTTDYDDFHTTTTGTGAIFGEVFGLFGVAGGPNSNVEIKNVSLKDVSISGSNLKGVGALIGAWSDYDKINYGTATLKLENITVDGNISAQDKSGGIIGALCHSATSADCNVELVNCVNNANVSATGKADNTGSHVRAGGLIGQISQGQTIRLSLKLDKCKNTGNVYAYNGNTVAGSDAMAGDFIGHFNVAANYTTLTTDNIKSKTQSYITLVDCSNTAEPNAESPVKVYEVKIVEGWTK